MSHNTGSDSDTTTCLCVFPALYHHLLSLYGMHHFPLHIDFKYDNIIEMFMSSKYGKGTGYRDCLARGITTESLVIILASLAAGVYVFLQDY